MVQKWAAAERNEQVIGVTCTNPYIFSFSVCADLSTCLGAHRRGQRRLLNPIFGVNKLRHMTPISSGLYDRISCHTFFLEIMGQGDLRYSSGTLEGRNDGYYKALEEWLPAASSLAVYRSLIPCVYKIFHPKFSSWWEECCHGRN
ncbi:hypothetical protein H4582DRAFT_1498423 [Lactarius indigo]|nr:hypothetical protein H4582DRAFT_1498423 [Lactarius indigo]